MLNRIGYIVVPALLLIGCFGDDDGTKKDPEKVQTEDYSAKFENDVDIEIDEDLGKIRFFSTKDSCTADGEVVSAEVEDIKYYEIVGGKLLLWRAGECHAMELTGGSDLTSTWMYNGETADRPGTQPDFCYGPFDEEIDLLENQSLKIGSSKATLIADLESYCPADEFMEESEEMVFSKVDCANLTLELDGEEAHIQILESNKQTQAQSLKFTYGGSYCTLNLPGLTDVDVDLCAELGSDYNSDSIMEEFNACVQDLGYPSLMGGN
jgi:hypothetical protein